MRQHWSVVLVTGLLIALASMGLAACGYPSANISSTLSHAQAAQSQSQTQVQQCGFVQGYGAFEAVPIDTGGMRAETCFWQAFQHCHLATLVFITNNFFNTSLIHTFTIHNDHGRCLISDARQSRVFANPPSSAAIYICAGLIRYPRALDFLACGKDGTILVIGS